MDHPGRGCKAGAYMRGAESEQMGMFTQDELVVDLLQQAGLSPTVASNHPLTSHGITNLMDIITLEDGTRLVLRRYQWPWEVPDLDRPQKERYVHALLRQAGVPVPTVLAYTDRAGQSAALMEFMPGQNLGDVASSLPEEAKREAWWSCGSALRRAHSISYPEGTYGIIVGDHLRPFAEAGSWEEEAPSWGHGQIHMIMDHFEQLSVHVPHLARVDQEMRETLTESLPYLNRTPPTLLHNDPHPWNVLVRSEGGHWQCSAWLDWEYAWVGDPNWDLVRMDLFRRQPIGRTPDAFWEGYGRYPEEPERSVYEMHINLWMANQYLAGDRQLPPTYAAAMGYVDHLDAAVQGIRRWLT
jgi:aminoglycoside phosphotransferase (APT) family kinase protein